MSVSNQLNAIYLLWILFDSAELKIILKYDFPFCRYDGDIYGSGACCKGKKNRTRKRAARSNIYTVVIQKLMAMTATLFGFCILVAAYGSVYCSLLGQFHRSALKFHWRWWCYLSSADSTREDFCLQWWLWCLSQWNVTWINGLLLL